MGPLELLNGVEPARLEAAVKSLEGQRHPTVAPHALERAEDLVADELGSCGLQVERRPFQYAGRRFNNVVGMVPGRSPDLSTLLVGAHFDSVAGSPGADDNASGVAVMLEVARLAARARPLRPMEFVGFNLEEQQDAWGEFRIGSSRFAAEARAENRPYLGAIVLEMVGYSDERPGSQAVPPLVFKRVPRAGTFLAAVGDRRSKWLLKRFDKAANRYVPELGVITYTAWWRGHLMPLTRLSDNASFWDSRYPSLMITDTAFLRNPHYHRPTDTADTLSLDFMTATARAVLAAVLELGFDPS